MNFWMKQNMMKPNILKIMKMMKIMKIILAAIVKVGLVHACLESQTLAAGICQGDGVGKRYFEGAKSFQIHGSADGNQYSASVYIPKEVADSRNLTPKVLYYFPGYGQGSFVGERQQATLSAFYETLRASGNIREPFVIVFLELGSGFGIDDPRAGEQQQESFIVHDLIGKFEKDCGLSPENRMVLGVSMGGYAALNLAAKYPGLFDRIAVIEPFLLSRKMKSVLKRGERERLAAAQNFQAKVQSRVLKNDHPDYIRGMLKSVGDMALQQWANRFEADPISFVAANDPIEGLSDLFSGQNGGQGSSSRNSNSELPRIAIFVGEQDEFGLSEGAWDLFSALKDNSRSLVTLEIMPGLNHMTTIPAALPKALVKLTESGDGSLSSLGRFLKSEVESGSNSIFNVLAMKIKQTQQQNADSITLRFELDPFFVFSDLIRRAVALPQGLSVRKNELQPFKKALGFAELPGEIASVFNSMSSFSIKQNYNRCGNDGIFFEAELATPHCSWTDLASLKALSCKYPRLLIPLSETAVQPMHKIFKAIDGGSANSQISTYEVLRDVRQSVEALKTTPSSNGRPEARFISLSPNVSFCLATNRQRWEFSNMEGFDAFAWTSLPSFVVVDKRIEGAKIKYIGFNPEKPNNMPTWEIEYGLLTIKSSWFQ